MADSGDGLDPTGLLVGVIVSSVLCLCCTACCVRVARGSKDDAHRRTGADRRRTLAASKAVVERFVAPTAHLVEHVTETSYYRTARSGKNLFVLEIAPRTGGGDAGAVAVKGVVCFCHGYLDVLQLLPTNTMRRLAAAGYVVAAQTYEGHGTSDGLHGLVEDFAGEVVGEMRAYFGEVRARHPGVPAFLYGESLGGAIALTTALQDPEGTYAGALLVAPMVKIADEMKPAPCVIPPLLWLARHLPTLQAVPSGEDLIDKAFKDPVVRALAKDGNPIVYEGKHRLATGSQLLALSTACEARLGDVTLPFLVVHGEADVVTDPAISRALHDQAVSADKTIILYEGAWHALTVGETKENVERLFGDLIGWLDARSSGGTGGGDKPAAAAGPAAAAPPTDASGVVVDVAESGAGDAKAEGESDSAPLV